MTAVFMCITLIFREASSDKQLPKYGLYNCLGSRAQQLFVGQRKTWRSVLDHTQSPRLTLQPRIPITEILSHSISAQVDHMPHVSPFRTPIEIPLSVPREPQQYVG